MLSSNLAAPFPLPNLAALCGRVDRIVAKAGPALSTRGNSYKRKSKVTGQYAFTSDSAQ